MKETLYEYLFGTLEMSNKDAIDCISYIQNFFPDITRDSIFSEIEQGKRKNVKSLIADFEISKL